MLTLSKVIILPREKEALAVENFAVDMPWIPVYKDAPDVKYNGFNIAHPGLLFPAQY